MRLLQDQKVLNGRVFEPTAKNRPHMRELVVVVEFQGWGHLFEWPIPFLHEWEVKEFFLNIEF